MRKLALDSGQTLEDAAWIKFRDGEPMSRRDIERLLDVFDRRNLLAETGDSKEFESLKQLASDVFSRYIAK